MIDAFNVALPVAAAFASIVERMEQHPGEIWPFSEWLYARHPVNVLEIGVRWGGTAALWHQLSCGRVIGLDWSACADGLGAANTYKLTASMEARYPRYRFIDGDSSAHDTVVKVVEALGGDTLDFLFIDGDHSYMGVWRDWDSYSGLVRSGGCIALHDIVDSPFMRSVGHGVYKFWGELEGEKTEFCVGGDWGGIGVIEV